MVKMMAVLLWGGLAWPYAGVAPQALARAKSLRRFLEVEARATAAPPSQKPVLHPPRLSSFATRRGRRLFEIVDRFTSAKATPCRSHKMVGFPETLATL